MSLNNSTPPGIRNFVEFVEETHDEVARYMDRLIIVTRLLSLLNNAWDYQYKNFQSVSFPKSCTKVVGCQKLSFSIFSVPLRLRFGHAAEFRFIIVVARNFHKLRRLETIVAANMEGNRAGCCSILTDLLGFLWSSRSCCGIRGPGGSWFELHGMSLGWLFSSFLILANYQAKYFNSSTVIGLSGTTPLRSWWLGFGAGAGS